MSIVDEVSERDLERQVKTYKPGVVPDILEFNAKEASGSVASQMNRQVVGMPRKSVTVLLPALNEEEGIGEVIDSIPRQEIENNGYKLNIVVVDGHSKDMTRKIAVEKGAEILLQRGQGKGNAVRTGFDILDSDFLIMMDADNSYPCCEIPTFLESLEKGADVVMGSRFMGHIEDGAMSDLNRAGNRILSFMASRLFNVKTTDVCTGMWGFNRKAKDNFRLNSHGFEIEAEMFAQAAKGNLIIHEVPINYTKRHGYAKLVSLDCGMKIAFKLIRKKFIR
ncbi:MAG: glycosyltransferase family 2 protein [Candidatus Hodarchaeota archaeon]